MEAKYILSLCDSGSEDVFEELLSYLDHFSNDSNQEDIPTMSAPCVEYLKRSIKINQLAVLQYMEQLKCCKVYSSNKNVSIIENIILNEIESLLDMILDCTDNNRKHNTGCLLSIIPHLEIHSQNQERICNDIFPKLHKLILAGYNKETYLSLLAQNKSIIKAFTEYEMKYPIKKFWNLDPNKMIDLCFGFNNHWLLEILSNSQKVLTEEGGTLIHSTPFIKKIWQLVLVNMINNCTENLDISANINTLENLFSILEYQSCEQSLLLYINEIYRQLNLIKFCVNNSKRNIFFGWCEKLQNHSALSVISQNCDLSHLDWFKVKQALTLNNDILIKLQNQQHASKDNIQWDIMTYNAFCIMTSIIDIILLETDSMKEQEAMANKIEEVKVMISNLYPISYRIEILQNIFSCLFLRYEYFSNEGNASIQSTASHSDSSYFIMKNSLSRQFSECRGFICKPPLVKEILSIVKISLSEIQNQKSTKKDEASHERIIKTFTKNVSNAMYRWQLITNLKVETPPKPSSISSLYKVTEFSSDEDEPGKDHPAMKKKLKRKRRCKSVNEDLLKSGSVSSEKSTTLDRPDFISLMLSSPSSLLALCLEAGEFSKANRIVEIYDMGDTEGSIEVSYTERFLSTAVQVRNRVLFCDDSPNSNIHQMEILTRMSVVSAAVVSLVESFLSTNRAPYNYQISELVHTYPQLQLYDHRNATLISIIDLLLSTGIDRNITDGIINVVEKKCQDLNVSTDLDSKQYDFLVFIKNIINIVYDTYQGSQSCASNLGICDIVRCDKISLNYKEYSLQKEFLIKLSKLCSELNSDDNDGTYESRLKSRLSEETLLNDCKLLLNLVPFSGKDIFGIYGSDHYGSVKTSESSYLKTFYAYVRNVTQLLNFKNQTSEDDMEKSEINLNVLQLHLHNIIGDLIFEQKVPIDSIEVICKSLGINLVHKIVLNCCPIVTCNKTYSSVYIEKFYDLIDVVTNCDSNLTASDLNLQTSELTTVCRKPNKSVITYILIHNWVIANLVKKMHSDSSEHILQQSLDARTKFLDSFLQEEKFDVLKTIYYNNKPLAAMQTSHDLELVFNYLRSLLTIGQLLKALEVIDVLPEHQLFSSPFLNTLRDQILLKLCVRDDNENNWKYFLYISDTELQVNNILHNLVNWPHQGAMRILEYICYSKESVDEAVKEQCHRWLSNLPIYEEIAQYSPESTWATIYSLSVEDPEVVLQILMDAQQFKLCLTWTDLHQVSTNIKNLVTHSFLRQWLESPNDRPIDELNALLSEIPAQSAITLCNDMMFKIRDLPVLKTVLDFLVHNTYDTIQYENINIGIELLSEMEVQERMYFWDIINKPLLIIEQYLMNAKLEKLAKFINKIKPMLKNDNLGENLYYNIALINTLTISVNSIDSLLRIYAAKALDLKATKTFRLASQPSNKPEEMFLQSIDSINMVGDSIFIMPEEVPPREQWIPDNQADRCMSCKTTIFSILIRRHHCRRCGRVVCYSCSRCKMQIKGLYDNINVRVCNDCHTQTMSKSENSFRNDKSLTQHGSGSANSDCTSMEWCLTADPRHNDEVRKEFVYEFSPNVTLCLTIMKMHSINFDYPRFLLDRSAELSLVAGSGGGAGGRELLKMRRALLLWCTVLYSRPLPAPAVSSYSAPSLTETALAHTERQLAATDAFTLLVTHGCHDMMPQEDVLDSHCVRRLLEAEKWELALEISTKFGMSRIGVLAAWGKACLKAGCFQQARQKFSLCFKNSPSHALSHYTDDVDNPNPLPNKSVVRLKKMESSISSSQLDLSRIRNNPALLDEIISLLENISYPINPQVIKKAELIKKSTHEAYLTSLHKPTKKMNTAEPALNIMHALASINKIKQGDYSDFTTHSQYSVVKKVKQLSILKKQSSIADKSCLNQKLDPFFYNECLYYLTAYGSHSAIIEFYLKYENMQEALKYCLDHTVDKEIFTENIFMPCLKSEKINFLLKCMSEIDSTWNIWTESLLYVCRVLEHRSLLEALHVVQSGVGDHIRAAMTCAGLYTRPTVPPHAAALLARAHHLAQARGHLQHVPRKVMGQDAMNKEASSKTLHLKMDGTALDKHINTVSRQLEIAKFLCACEASGRLTEEVVDKIMPSVTEESHENKCFLPTLFDSHSQKMKLAVIMIICSTDIQEGFDISARIIQEHLLDAPKIYNHVARYLVNSERYDDILQLCDCIKKWNSNSSSSICDGMVEVSVATVVRKCDSKGQLFDELAELLIQKVDDVAIKISCYIECRILKTAYALAVKSNRPADLKRIMREAERLGQTKVKNACIRRLQNV